MKTSRRTNPSVNSGSMADIAFLLLIFFLVTTTISAEKGILRQLPPECNDNCIAELHERNVLEIFINKNDEILIEDKLIAIKDVKHIAKEFIDNNGDTSCSYCKGANSKESSDNPIEAVVSLKHHSQTTYGIFIKVQDQLAKAYAELRSEYSQNTYNKSIGDLTTEELISVKQAYPIKISEANTDRKSN